MRGIPQRYSHVVFGVLQSGLTSAIAAAVALLPDDGGLDLLQRRLGSRLLAWSVMLPIVADVAPEADLPHLSQGPISGTGLTELTRAAPVSPTRGASGLWSALQP